MDRAEFQRRDRLEETVNMLDAVADLAGSCSDLHAIDANGMATLLRTISDRFKEDLRLPS